MKLWQLSLVIWALIAAMPYAVHAIATHGVPSGVKAACRVNPDPHLQAECKAFGVT